MTVDDNYQLKINGKYELKRCGDIGETITHLAKGGNNITAGIIEGAYDSG